MAQKNNLTAQPDQPVSLATPNMDRGRDRFNPDLPVSVWSRSSQAGMGKAVDGQAPDHGSPVRRHGWTVLLLHELPGFER